MSTLSPNQVAVQTVAGYGTAPYHPSEIFPEFRRILNPDKLTTRTSPVYAAVRNLLAELGLDRSRFGKPEWNPFQRFVRPGGRVLVKPNWVLHEHPEGKQLDSLVTHSSLIRPLLDYLALAMNGQGTILIADAPLPECDFKKLIERAGVEEVIRACQDTLSCRDTLKMEFCDLRKSTASPDGNGSTIRDLVRTGDPLGYLAVNLGERSLHAGCPTRCSRYQSLHNGRAHLSRHQAAPVHEYLVARSALTADFVINLPKLKTDQKTGLSFALKNLLGIQGNPNWLPHYTAGSPAQGGDEHPCLNPDAAPDPDSGSVRPAGDDHARRARRLPSPPGILASRHAGSRSFTEGSWYANDTLWRTILDLNRIFLEASSNGESGSRRTERYLIVGDAVVAGEGEGPFRPRPHKVGLLFAGINPGAVDTLAAGGLGFDPRHIPLIRNARLITRQAWPAHPDHVQISANRNVHQYLLGDLFPTLRAPAGWIGHLEKTRSRASV